MCNPDPTICPEGQQWNHDNSSCVPIHQNCSSEEEWNNDTLSCVLIEDRNYPAAGPIFNSTPSTITVQVTTGAGAGVGFLSALLSGSSAQDAWSIIHIMQLVLILPLIAKYVSSKVKDFVVSNAYSSL